MKICLNLIKKIVIAAFVLYCYNCLLFNYFPIIPINIITIALTTIFNVFGIVGLIIFYSFLWGWYIWEIYR